jgi:hypothetical protein
MPVLLLQGLAANLTVETVKGPKRRRIPHHPRRRRVRSAGMTTAANLLKQRAIYQSGGSRGMSSHQGAGRREMAKKTVKRREWTKEDVRTLKTLAREKTKTTAIARQLKRSVGALYQQASKLGVSLGAPRKKRKG